MVLFVVAESFWHFVGRHLTVHHLATNGVNTWGSPARFLCQGHCYPLNAFNLAFFEGIGTHSFTYTFFLLTTVPLASQLGAGVTTFGILLSPGQCCVNALAGRITYCISFDISGRQMQVE
jgi:hypothetical protein